MKGLLALLLLAAPASAGVWTKTGPGKMSFKGGIELGEYDRFAAVFGPSIKEIVVDSEGGVTFEGIRIAHAIAAQSVKIIVTGECLSSCANYLFVAGHSREIRGGVVGYHGNVQACFGTPAKRAAWIEKMKNHYHMTPEDIRRNLEAQDKEVADEARLMSMMGVSQELFERSCKDDKGMGDGKGYVFLLPKRATFEKYGLWGIVGEQDPAVMKSLPFPFAHD